MKTKGCLVFDYRTIRLLIGAIMLFLPVIVIVLSSGITDSISYGYYTNARNYFVGLLFVVGAFLMCYKGRPVVIDKAGLQLKQKWLKLIVIHQEDIIAYLGGVSAWVAAVNPTSSDISPGAKMDSAALIHFISSIILFLTAVYFCLFAFRRQLNVKFNNVKIEAAKEVGLVDHQSKSMEEMLSQMDEGGRKKFRKRICPIVRRKILYLFSGIGILFVMLFLAIVYSTDLAKIPNITFVGEFSMMLLFGFTWLTASHYLPWFSSKDEREKTPIEIALLAL